MEKVRTNSLKNECSVKSVKKYVDILMVVFGK